MTALVIAIGACSATLTGAEEGTTGEDAGMTEAATDTGANDTSIDTGSDVTVDAPSDASTDVECTKTTTSGCPCGVLCASNRCSNGGCEPLVFVTSTSFTGRFASGSIQALQVADATCDSLAVNIPRTPKTTFLPWLSGHQNILDRFMRSTRPYRLSNQARSVIATSFAALASDLQHPIDADETGAQLLGAIGVWTGAGRDGSPKTDNCVNWTISAPPSITGVFGLTDRTTVSWSEHSSAGCDQSYRLYCFEQLP